MTNTTDNRPPFVAALDTPRWADDAQPHAYNLAIVAGWNPTDERIVRHVVMGDYRTDPTFYVVDADAPWRGPVASFGPGASVDTRDTTDNMATAVRYAMAHRPGFVPVAMSVSGIGTHYTVTPDDMAADGPDAIDAIDGPWNVACGCGPVHARHMAYAATFADAANVAMAHVVAEVRAESLI